MAIDLEQYQAPNPTHGYHDALLSALEDLSSGKSGAAACDQKKYLKTRYQPALQDLSPASLSRQLAHLLIEVNFNALMPVDYHFKGPHSYMNSYSDTITTFQRLQNTLTYQKVDVMIPLRSLRSSPSPPLSRIGAPHGPSPNCASCNGSTCTATIWISTT